MLVILALLLASTAWPRHIIEGPIVEEIAQATNAVSTLDQELARPTTTPERRVEAQNERSSSVGRISSLAESNPQSAPVNLAAAGGLLRVREPARAETAANRVVTAAPQNPDGYMLRARARMDQGRFDVAADDFKRALSLRPGDPAALAGLKLTEGRTSLKTDSQGSTPKPSNPSTGMLRDPGAQNTISETDRIAMERKRRDSESLSLYNEAQIAQAKGNWELAIEKAEKAYTLSPHSTFLNKYLESVKQARDVEKRPKPQVVEPATTEAKPIGSASFLGGFLHYAGKSAKPRRVKFNDIDTSDVKIRDFPQPSAILKNSVGEGSHKIDSTISWSTKRAQWLFLGSISLRLRGTLTVRTNCNWEFEGSLRSWDDKYDFNASKRGFLGETLTTIGRNTPGKNYAVEIRGVKPMRESGKLENCR